MATFDDIRKANEAIRTTDIKGKDYAEVNQRVKAFRMVYPHGCIKTELVSNENGLCVFKAEVYSGLTAEDNEDGYEDNLLATGHAYEKEGSSFINKTSHLENAETSAIGRALGFCGFGIDTSIASYEEVANAKMNQGDSTEERNVLIAEIYNIMGKEGFDEEKVYKKSKISSVEELPTERLSGMVAWLKSLNDANRKELM